MWDWTAQTASRNCLRCARCEAGRNGCSSVAHAPLVHAVQAPLRSRNRCRRASKRALGTLSRRCHGIAIAARARKDPTHSAGPPVDDFERRPSGRRANVTCRTLQRRSFHVLRCREDAFTPLVRQASAIEHHSSPTHRRVHLSANTHPSSRCLTTIFSSASDETPFRSRFTPRLPRVPPRRSRLPLPFFEGSTAARRPIPPPLRGAASASYLDRPCTPRHRGCRASCVRHPRAQLRARSS